MIENLPSSFFHIRHEIKRDFSTLVQNNYCSELLILHKSILLKLKTFRSVIKRCNIFYAHMSVVLDDKNQPFVLFCRPRILRIILISKQKFVL